MSDQLKRFKDAVDALAKTEEENDAVEMTIDEFIDYATAQVEAALKDGVEIRKSRLEALSEAANIAKEFIGSPSTPGGSLKVVQFKDPAQIATTEATQGTKKPAEGPDKFSENGVQPPVNGAGSASGQKMPPLTAGGSGFETTANATFAKSLEELSKVISSLIVEEGPKEEESVEKSEEPVIEEKQEEKVEEEVVEKAETEEKKEEVKKEDTEIAFWPDDMNTPYGMGEVSDQNEPPWGYDHGKSPEDSE